MFINSQPVHGVRSMDLFTPPKPLILEGKVSENWKKWVQRYDLYMEATEKNKKTEKIQCAMFLHLAGEEAIEVYNTLTFEDAEKGKITPLKAKFEEYCLGVVSETHERLVFNSRVQEQGEKFDKFLTALKTLANKCSYGDLESSLIRDRIIYGIASQETRKKLMNKGSALTLTQAIEICRSDELTGDRIKSLSSNSSQLTSHDVHAVRKKKRQFTPRSQYQSHPTSGRSQSSQFQSRPGQSHHGQNHPSGPRYQSQQQKCTSCGYKHGNQKPCPAKGKMCNNCGRMNHFRSVCRARPKHVQTVQQNHHDHDNDPSYQYQYENSASGGYDADVGFLCDSVIQERNMSDSVDHILGLHIH